MTHFKGSIGTSMQIFTPRCNRHTRSDVSPRTRYQSYHEYLDSGHWKQIKHKCAKIYGSRCVVCHSAEQLNFHHIFYPKIRVDIRAHQVLPLCGKCHATYHKHSPKDGVHVGNLAPREIGDLISDIFFFIELNGVFDEKDYRGQRHRRKNKAWVHRQFWKHQNRYPNKFCRKYKHGKKAFHQPKQVSPNTFRPQQVSCNEVGSLTVSRPE